MFGRWRKTDGFKWVGYVPTRIVERRKARRERLEKAAAGAKEGAREIARKSAAGIGNGVGQAGAALASGGGSVARGVAEGARGMWRELAPRVAARALDVLKTRRVAGGAPLTRNQQIAQGATLAAAVTAGAALLGGAGWGAWRVTAAVLGDGPALAGVARVVDTELLKIGDTQVRLAGIAAPDTTQTCGERNRKWRCGDEARRALSTIAAGKHLSCRLRGADASGSRLAHCFDGKTDIGATLVAAGHVWADKDDTMGYRARETVARAAKAGVWKSESVTPWSHRERLWEDARKAAPDGCPVKAAVSGGDRLYHLPWQESYTRVKMARGDVAKGTRAWFCSEDKARAAGFARAGDRR